MSQSAFGHFNVDNGKVLTAQASSASCEHYILTLVVQVRYAEDIFVVSILLSGSASIFAT